MVAMLKASAEKVKSLLSTTQDKCGRNSSAQSVPGRIIAFWPCRNSFASGTYFAPHLFRIWSVQFR